GFRRLTPGTHLGPCRFALWNRLPPLAPPVAPDQDAELRVPAVRKILVRLEVVTAVGAPFVARGMPTEDLVVHQVAQLDGESLVDLLRLWLGNRVVGHIAVTLAGLPWFLTIVV